MPFDYNFSESVCRGCFYTGMKSVAVENPGLLMPVLAIGAAMTLHAGGKGGDWAFMRLCDQSSSGGIGAIALLVYHQGP